MARCECLDVERCHLYHREKDGATSGRCGAEATTERFKTPYCEPCALNYDRLSEDAAARLHSNPDGEGQLFPLPRAVPIPAPGSTVDDLQNDLAALENAEHALAFAVSAGWNGGNGCDPEAVRVWLLERIQETANTISGLDGSGMPCTTATVGIEIEGGLVQAVYADVPARVIVLDKDDPDTSYPRTLDLGGGILAFVNEHEATGDAQDRDTVKGLVAMADEANARQEAHNSAPSPEAVSRALEDVPAVPPCSDEEASRG